MIILAAVWAYALVGLTVSVFLVRWMQRAGKDIEDVGPMTFAFWPIVLVFLILMWLWDALESVILFLANGGE